LRVRRKKTDATNASSWQYSIVRVAVIDPASGEMLAKKIIVFRYAK
jgi:hypothetical protein